MARRLSSSSSLDNHHDDDSSSSSVIDLLLSIKPFQRSVSASELFPESGDVDDATEEEVHAERSVGREYRVTYMNHRRSYVAPPSLGNGTDVYKSYLSLLPNETVEKSDEKCQKRQEEIERILSQFRSLSSWEQAEQRKLWKNELTLVEKDILETRTKLRDRLKRRTALKRLLGMAKVHDFLVANFNQVEQKLTDLTEKTSQNIQTAIAATAKNASALQRVAKKSVDHITQEFRDLVLMNSTTLPNESKEETNAKTCDQNYNSLVEEDAIEKSS